MTVGRTRGSAVAGLLSGLFAAGCILLSAPAALAAAPPNDDFASREVLSGSLPIEVTRTNVEATKQAGEYIPGLAPAGHSVWFEWEATSTGWVTIGACNDGFPTILAIFTGTELGHLMPVVSGNADEGPDCPYHQSQYTFKATSGTKYVIAVDGNIYHLPEAPTPATEGEIALRIEATPPPPNDDFANAATFLTPLEEESEGEAFYRGQMFGYNWNATEESDEPSLIGGPGGASVWYSWTAPLSAEARISTEFPSSLRLGLYSGASLEGLQLLFGGIGPYGSATFTATAGRTYRVVVYGLLEGSSEAAMGAFRVNLSMRAPVPVPPSPPPPPPPATTLPDTTVFKRMLKRRPPVFVFDFQSTEPGSTFRCKLDHHPFAGCPSSERFGHLKPGQHVLEVVAVDTAGNVDATPAVARFMVPKVAKHLQKRAKTDTEPQRPIERGEPSVAPPKKA